MPKTVQTTKRTPPARRSQRANKRKIENDWVASDDGEDDAEWELQQQMFDDTQNNVKIKRIPVSGRYGLRSRNLSKITDDEKPENCLILGARGSGKTKVLLSKIKSELESNLDTLVVYGILSDIVKVATATRQVGLFDNVQKSLISDGLDSSILANRMRFKLFTTWYDFCDYITILLEDKSVSRIAVFMDDTFIGDSSLETLGYLAEKEVQASRICQTLADTIANIYKSVKESEDYEHKIKYIWMAFPDVQEECKRALQKGLDFVFQNHKNPTFEASSWTVVHRESGENTKHPGIIDLVKTTSEKLKTLLDASFKQKRKEKTLAGLPRQRRSRSKTVKIEVKVEVKQEALDADMEIGDGGPVSEEPSAVQYFTYTQFKESFHKLPENTFGNGEESIGVFHTKQLPSVDNMIFPMLYQKFAHYTSVSLCNYGYDYDLELLESSKTNFHLKANTGNIDFTGFSQFTDYDYLLMFLDGTFFMEYPSELTRILSRANKRVILVLRDPKKQKPDFFGPPPGMPELPEFIPLPLSPKPEEPAVEADSDYYGLILDDIMQKRQFRHPELFNNPVETIYNLRPEQIISLFKNHKTTQLALMPETLLPILYQMPILDHVISNFDRCRSIASSLSVIKLLLKKEVIFLEHVYRVLQFFEVPCEQSLGMHGRNPELVARKSMLLSTWFITIFEAESEPNLERLQNVLIQLKKKTNRNCLEICVKSTIRFVPGCVKFWQAQISQPILKQCLKFCNRNSELGIRSSEIRSIGGVARRNHDLDNPMCVFIKGVFQFCMPVAIKEIRVMKNMLHDQASLSEFELVNREVNIMGLIHAAKPKRFIPGHAGNKLINYYGYTEMTMKRFSMVYRKVVE